MVQEIHSINLKKTLSTIEKIANLKINQGVLLKELSHSIRANAKEKTPNEWKEWVFNHLNKMLNMERDILEC